MARIEPLEEKDAPEGVRSAFAEHRTRYGARITNMKATLGHSLTAFEVYMEWYRLYGRVGEILGKRLACLYAYSISVGSGCPLCSTFFRKIIIDNGEKPEDIVFREEEQIVLDFGAAISVERGKIDRGLFERVNGLYSLPEVVELIAFAGQMVATNIFANVTETDIDEYLQDYIKR